jgi:hypothetical protein
MFDCKKYITALLRVRLSTFNRQIVSLHHIARDSWWHTDVPMLKEWLVDPALAYEMTAAFHSLNREEFDKRWEQSPSTSGTTHQDLIFLITNTFEDLQHVLRDASSSVYELLSGMSTHNTNAFVHWCSIFLMARRFWFSVSQQSWIHADEEAIEGHIYEIITDLGLSGGSDALALGDLVRGWLDNGLPGSLKAACYDQIQEWHLKEVSLLGRSYVRNYC